MPIYEYRCSKCGHVFERFESIRNYSQTLECPVCGETAHLMISGGNGLIFKGSGFYITDYKKNGSGKSQSQKSENKNKSSD